MIVCTNIEKIKILCKYYFKKNTLCINWCTNYAGIARKCNLFARWFYGNIFHNITITFSLCFQNTKLSTDVRFAFGVRLFNFMFFRFQMNTCALMWMELVKQFIILVVTKYRCSAYLHMIYWRLLRHTTNSEDV